MLIEGLRWTRRGGWQSRFGGSRRDDAQLVLYFGACEAVRDPRPYLALRAAYPGAQIVGGSATAAILEAMLHEQDVVAIAIAFERTRITVVQQSEVTDSLACGEWIGRSLAGAGLAAVLVLGDGMRINGSILTAGLNRTLSGRCPVSGGMTSDSGRFVEALVGANAVPNTDTVAAIGFYGRNIRFSFASACGWVPFGPRRRITRSAGNVLMELDGEPALSLYERYLGEEVAGNVAASAILPLLICDPDQPAHMVARSSVAVDADSGSITYGGDMPEGWTARLMLGSPDGLAQTAGEAAQTVCARLPEPALHDRLALIVSCVGHRSLMGQRTIEEIDCVAQEIGSDVRLFGFYSLAEIAPIGPAGSAELLNQTMVITGLAEVAD